MKRIYTVSRKVREKLQKEIDKFNKRIDKARRSGINKDMLPDKLDYVEVMSKRINSSHDLQVTNKLLKTMNKKKSNDVIESENGAKITKALDDFFKIQVKEKNRNIEEKKKAFKQMGTVAGRPMTEDEYNLMQNNLNSSKIREYNYDFNKKRQVDIPWIKKALKNYYESYNAQDEVYKNNYLRSLREVLPDHLYKRMLEFMKTVPASQLAISYQTDIALKIEVNYLHDGDDIDTMNEFVKTTMMDWNRAMQRGKDFAIPSDDELFMSKDSEEEYMKKRKAKEKEDRELYNLLKQNKADKKKLTDKQKQFMKWFERRY